MTEHPNYGYWVKHPAHNPKGTHNTIPLTEADKRDGWTEVVLVAQQPAAHVQNPAGIEHVAGDVSKNGPESNMAQQPAPSAASKAVLAAIRAANMQLVRTGDDEFMLVTYKNAEAQCDGGQCGIGGYCDDCPTPQADSQPAAALEITTPNDSGSAQCIVRWQIETPRGWVGAWNREALEWLLGRAPADSVTAPAAFQRALDIRAAQGWKLGGDKIPVLYTDTINGEQVCRDDIWLCTTAAFATPPAQAADSVLEDAARLEQIAEAIRDYHHALDLRKHGGLAESAAFNSICQTMGMPWNQGEEAARRAARKQGGAT